MLKVVTHIDYTLVGDGEDSEWSGGYVNPDGVNPSQSVITQSTQITIPVPAKAVGVVIVFPRDFTVIRTVAANSTDVPHVMSGYVNFWGPIKFPSPGFVTNLVVSQNSSAPEYWTFYWL